jgi:hypothetical protein
MPNLGIIASSISGNLWAPGKDFDSIATTTVGGGGAASVTFSSIPSTYRHLQIRMLVRSSSTSNGYTLQINSDTGSNYTKHYLYGTGSAAAAAGLANTTSIILSDGAVSTSTSGVFGGAVCDILDYTSTTKNKTVRTLGGFDNNGNGGIFFNSGLYFATPAVVSTLTITPDAGSFVQYSQFALYGVK